MTVKAILDQKGDEVYTIEPNYSLHIAAGLMREHKIGSLVVCNAADEMVGIISERDIVSAIANRGAVAVARPVKDVMTREVHTCGPTDSVQSIMERMTTGKFRHLPVIVDGQLGGIISIGDVVKFRVAEMAQEQEALRDYVQQG